MEVEMTCVNETETFFVQLVEDLAVRFKSAAAIAGTRLVRYGCFSNAEHALLAKYVSVDRVIEHNQEMNKLLEVNTDVLSNFNMLVQNYKATSDSDPLKEIEEK